MKYTRGQFTNEYYQLWEKGLLLHVPRYSSVYSIKYRKNEINLYSRVTLKAVSIGDALERACYAISYGSSWRPEDIDLHAVYDEEENLIWIDEPYHDLVQKKNEFRGMDRREFLKKFGVTSAAVLYGLQPSVAEAVIPFGFIRKINVMGEQLYTTSGSYNWTVPNGVTKVAVVCIGGGGGGGGTVYEHGPSGCPGGGGGLGWQNNIQVSPGQSLTVIVGAGGACGLRGQTPGGAGNDSYFNSNTTVLGAGGQGGSISYGGVGGSYHGTGGGSGGTGGLNSQDNGSGGGGSGGMPGVSGVVGAPHGGAYGGGAGNAGGSYSGSFGFKGGTGGSGAIRIIWGTDRSFPNKAS